MRLLIAFALVYLLTVLAMFLAQRWFMYPAPRHPAPLPPGFERIVMRTADGFDLAAAYRRAGKGMPTLVYFHGNGDSWTGGAQATGVLARESVGILLAGYRGYGGNAGRPDEAGLYADGRAALNWLNARGIARERLIVAGNSLGSGVATQMAFESAPAALILVSPFTGMPDVVAHHYPWLPGRWLVRDRFDTLAKLGQIAAPTLIVHGNSDRVIPVVQAERLARSKSGTELRLFDGLGHELAYLPEAQAAQAEWLKVIGLISSR